MTTQREMLQIKLWNLEDRYMDLKNLIKETMRILDKDFLKFKEELKCYDRKQKNKQSGD